ncbi:MAG: ATP-binding protein [Cyanobacteria bacterium P01_F01_bin.53]
MNPSPPLGKTTAETKAIKQNLFSRLKVNQRITLGFSLALGLAFAGTGAGIVIGNYYQVQALNEEAHVRKELNLLSQLQTGVLQSRTHQQQLIPLSEFPEDFQDEYSHILKHSETIKSVLQSLTMFIEESSRHSEPGHVVDISKIDDFLEEYDGIPTTYLDELDRIVTSIDPNSLNTPEDVERAQQALLTFTNSDLAISFDGISDDLSGIIATANEELSQARQSAKNAQALRNRLIILSMALSSVCGGLLAWLISRSINAPLTAMEKTALQITQNDNFDLRAEVMGNDEVGTVASAFNLLIQRVENLLSDQRVRAQELEEINQKLVSTQRQMIAQEKLASLGSLTAGIAHEIKNPLNFVNNFAELSVELADELKEELDPKKEQFDPDLFSDVMEIIDTLKENVSKIDYHGKRADKIVANMLQHSRNGNNDEWEAVNLNELIAEAVNLAYHGMRAKQSDFNLDFDNDYDESIDTIKGSSQDLSRVFLNIASNACYAIYQRQLTEGPDFKPLLKVRSRQEGNNVVVYIRDNGPGMSTEVMDKVFDQFFTTKPTGEGTGLGLSLSYNIVVEQHNGTMEVASEEGIYTDFIVTLPA